MAARPLQAASGREENACWTAYRWPRFPTAADVRKCFRAAVVALVALGRVAPDLGPRRFGHRSCGSRGKPRPEMALSESRQIIHKMPDEKRLAAFSASLVYGSVWACLGHKLTLQKPQFFQGFLQLPHSARRSLL